MRLTIPLTGTVQVEGSVWGEGKLTGDPNDPIRPISIDLGNVSWTMVDVDLENGEMIINVEPAEEIDEDTGGVNGSNSIYRRRPCTQQERQEFLQHAKNLIEGHKKDELYVMSGCSRIKRSFKV